MRTKRTNSPGNKELPPKQIFYDEKWLATRWGVSVKFIQKTRYTGIGGPTYWKIGGRVRYRLQDVRKFEQSLRKRKSTSE
ncbi:MAG: hypothetical protein JWQ16_899 [Novosphingobium sp.]|nr:hypothetical protein [Novosphingobium sp.]